MPCPATRHQHLLLPLIAICVVVPRGARPSLSSSSSHMTSDMPSAPQELPQGCSLQTPTTRFYPVTYHPPGSPACPTQSSLACRSLSGGN